MDLRTDYKDDIFAGARKYQMVNNPDGTVSFVDVTNYTQEGDYLGAQDINAITSEVNEKAPSNHEHVKSDVTNLGSATQTESGLMSVADKKKLDGIEDNANNYSHPTSPGNNHIPAGGVAGQVLKYNANGVATWGEDKDTVYTHPSTHPPTILSDGALPIGVTAAGSNTDYGVARLRNIQAGTTDLTPNSSAVASGYLYIVYE